MHIAAKQRTAGAILRHQRVTVVEELRRAGRTAARLEQTAQRIIGQSRRLRTRRRPKTILVVIRKGDAADSYVREITHIRTPQ